MVKQPHPPLLTTEYRDAVTLIGIGRGRKGIMADIFITLQETKYIILILDIMIQYVVYTIIICCSK